MKGFIKILLIANLYSCSYNKSILTNYDVNLKTNYIIKLCNDNKYNVSYSDGFTYNDFWHKLSDTVLVLNGINKISVSGYDSVGLKSRIIFATDQDNNRFRQSSLLIVNKDKPEEITPSPFAGYWILEKDKNITDITIKTPCGQTEFFGDIPEYNVINLKCNFSELTCIERKRPLKFDTIYLRKKYALTNYNQKLKYGK